MVLAGKRRKKEESYSSCVGQQQLLRAADLFSTVCCYPCSVFCVVTEIRLKLYLAFNLSSRLLDDNALTELDVNIFAGLSNLGWL